MIVNTGSVHSLVSLPACTAYDAAKAGVLGLTRTLAIDQSAGSRQSRADCGTGFPEDPFPQRLDLGPLAGRRRREKAAAFGCL